MKNSFKKPKFFDFLYLITSAVFLTIFATWGVTTLNVATERVADHMIPVTLIVIMILLLWFTILGLMWYKLFLPWNELNGWIALIKLRLINQQTVDNEIRQLAIRVQQIYAEVEALTFDQRPDKVSELTGERLCEALSKFQAIQCLAKDLGFLVGKSYKDYLSPRVIYEPPELAKSGDMDYT